MGIKYDEKSCGIVVFREGGHGEREYLILKYPSGHFDFVKGHVEEDESEHETATRELLEETGISDIEYVDGFRVEISYIYKRKGKMSNKQVVFFLGKTEMKDVKISFEHLDFHWMPFDAAFNKATFDNAKNLLRKSEELLNG